MLAAIKYIILDFSIVKEVSLANQTTLIDTLSVKVWKEPGLESKIFLLPYMEIQTNYDGDDREIVLQ